MVTARRPKTPPSVSAGLEQTLRTLSGALGPSDDALVAAARGLASAVEADPANAALWRQYLAALADLRGVGAGGVDDDTSDFLLTVRTPRRSTLGDAKKS